MLVATLCAWTLLQLIDITLALPRSPLVPRHLESREASITVPSCAASCVQTLIQQSFPKCANQQDLNCLCTNRSLTGYTIGEDILQCVISDCANATSHQLSQVYSICNSIPNAVLPTHATITANIATETTIFAEPQSASTSSPAIAATSTTPIPTTSVTLLSSSTAQATPAASTSSSVAPTATPVVNPSLPNSAIIGISVGLGVLALIAMALLSYICCCRRRDRRESSQSYETTKQPLISENEPSNAPFPIPPPRANPYVPSKAQSFLGQKYSGWSPTSTSNQATFPSYQALAVTPRDERSITPPSAATYQTTSQLLPEKPSIQSPPRPMRDRTEDGSLTVPLAAQTRSSSSRYRASPDSFDSGRVIHKKPSDPFLQVPAPRYNPSQVTAEDPKTAKMNLPKLNTKTVQFTNQPQVPSTTQQQRAPAPYNPASYVHFAETQTPNWRSPIPAQIRNVNIVQPGLALTTEAAVPIITRPARDMQPFASRAPEAAFDKYRPIPPPKSRRAASTITSFESEAESDIAPVPPLTILKKPVPASTIQSGGQQTRQQRYPAGQKQAGQSSSTKVDTPLSRVQYPTIPTITMTPVSSNENSQNLPFSSQESTTGPSQLYRAPSSPMDVSRLLDRGFVELPERNSGQEWVPVKLVATPSLQALNFSSNTNSYGRPSTYQGSSSTQPRAPLPSASSPPQQPAPRMLVELPSPDAERLTDPIAQAGEQLASRSPKSESRGARLGAAIASKTPQARPRGNSESNVRIPLPPAPKMGHMRSRSHAVDTKPQPLKMYRPLEEIGLEPAARRQIQLRPGPPY